jgi:hypothetical protein
MKTPRKFHEIQAIVISAEQLAYVQARKHPDDDDRLADKFPKPERRVNRYK